MLLLLGLAFICSEKILSQEMKLWYTRPATHWMTSALPIGNGELGALFFGGIVSEHIQFNEKTLWTGSPSKRGCYQNFGDVLLHFDGIDESVVEGYRRELSLDDALGQVNFSHRGVNYHREFFASHPDNVIVMRFSTSGKKEKLNFSIFLKDGRDGVVTIVGNDKFLLQNQLDYLIYEAQLKVLNEGGSVMVDNGQLRVKEADAVTLLLTGATNFNLASSDYLGENKGQLHTRLSSCLEAAAKKGYRKLRENHLADYRPLFERVKLDLKEAAPTVPTDKLVKKFRNSRYLDMLYFQYGRYLMIASSRGMNMPNNLQGIWNADNKAPWECDIHSNINIQMNYWPAETANLSECHLPFLEYVAEEAVRRPEGSWRKIAREEGLRGWTVKTQNNIFGYSDWNINRPANAWYCMHMWQHYAFTLDMDFLQNTAFPVLKSSCEYWFDRLKMDEHGKWIAPDEWSPEQGPWEDGVAYAQQLVWQLFRETQKAVDVLKKAGFTVEKEFAATLNDRFTKLDNGLEIGSWGQIKEWKLDSGNLDYHGNAHRHLSQLIALYPGNQISYHLDPQFANAARQTLLSRGDTGTGWSRAWKISCWARLFDGDHAYLLLKSALNPSTVTVVSMKNMDGGVYDNLFDSHPPFQIDGNFGATAGIIEMLLQSHMGYIHLLPALPTAWREGCVKGIRAAGDFTIDIAWNNGSLTNCTILSGSGETCRVYCPDNRIFNIKDETGQNISVSTESDKMISFRTKKGGTYILTLQ